jgi:hypothetical protein
VSWVQKEPYFRKIKAFKIGGFWTLNDRDAEEDPRIKVSFAIL